jgi:hypothetical protein
VDQYRHSVSKYGTTGKDTSVLFNLLIVIVLVLKIWIHIPVDRTGKGEAALTTQLQNIIEKKSIINLVGLCSYSQDDVS